MSHCIRLNASRREALLHLYRRPPQPEVRLRAHIILLLAEGFSWALIAQVLFCSSRTIDRWQTRFREGGIAALHGEPRGRWPWRWEWWSASVVRWVTRRTPTLFGYYRSRWSCAVVALLLGELAAVRISRETVRRWLHRANLVWRRPRPVLARTDPEGPEKLRLLRQRLRDLPADEVAVFQDEVDINTNPKIGAMWMHRGVQAEVPTPGDNEKRYLAGSLNWRTGALLVTEGWPKEGRSALLFLRHLDDLRVQLRRYRKIHVICDNARAHTCRQVQKYVKCWGHRIVIHYLPKYAPETNPIERVWWHLHEEITRNHRCLDIEDLLDLVFGWLENRGPFAIEGSIYPRARAA